jgi:hypothetical protein
MNYFLDVAQDPRVAAGVSTATTGTGLGTLLNWIPGSLGEIATLVGIALSIVLIYVHLRREFRESRHEKIELDYMRRREEMRDRIAALRDRGPE